MIGHQSIIELRLHGYRPISCWVNLYDVVPVYSSDFWHPEFQLEQGCHAEVHVLPDENVHALDFRFLNGVNAILTDMDNDRQSERLRALFGRVVQFEPARAVAIVQNQFLWFTPQQGVMDLNATQPATEPEQVLA